MVFARSGNNLCYCLFLPFDSNVVRQLEFIHFPFYRYRTAENQLSKKSSSFVVSLRDFKFTRLLDYNLAELLSLILFVITKRTRI